MKQFILLIIIISILVPITAFADDVYEILREVDRQNSQDETRGATQAQQQEAIDNIMSHTQFGLNVYRGLMIITLILLFIIQFIKMGAMPSHPIQRRESIANLVKLGVATMGIGATWLVFEIFLWTFLAQ